MVTIPSRVTKTPSQLSASQRKMLTSALAEVESGLSDILQGSAIPYGLFWSLNAAWRNLYGLHHTLGLPLPRPLEATSPGPSASVSPLCGLKDGALRSGPC